MEKLNVLDPGVWKDLPVRTRKLVGGAFGLRCKICGEKIEAGQRFLRRGNHCAHEECVEKLVKVE